MNFIKRMFAPKVTPAVGEVWQMCRSVKHPWDIEEPIKVEILDLKDGWVRFQCANYKPSQLPISTFLEFYHRLPS